MSQVIDPPSPTVDPRLRARRIEVKRSEGRKRLRRLLVAVAVTVLCAAAWGLTRSPLLDVDALEVAGIERIDRETVVEVAGIGLGDALVDLDLGAVVEAVSGLAWVDRAEVHRSWWGTVTISVTERRPVAVVGEAGGATHLVDRSGWVLGPPTTADLATLPTIDGIGAIDPGDRVGGVERVAVDLIGRAPAGLLDWVERVTVADEELWLELDPGSVTAAGGTPGHPGRVQLGDGRSLDAQLVAANTMLARVDLSCLEVIDVRVPASPVVRRAEGCSGGEAA